MIEVIYSHLIFHVKYNLLSKYIFNKITNMSLRTKSWECQHIPILTKHSGET